MVLTEKRLLANQQNSLKARRKCTGPKNFANTKYNAVKHGLTSLHPVMPPHEGEEEYEMLCVSIRGMLPLKDGGADMLAEKIAFCFWRLRRVMNIETEIVKSHANLDGIDWQGLLKSNYLGKICKYERRIMNYLNKMLKEFEDYSNTKGFPE